MNSRLPLSLLSILALGGCKPSESSTSTTASSVVPAVEKNIPRDWKEVDWGTPVEKKLYAEKSIHNTKAPEPIVEEWISAKPEMVGKFVLIDFWATWCSPCRAAIKELNELSKQFPEDLVVIGISDEKASTVREMKKEVIEYFNAVDTKATTKKAIGISGIPHVILIDPSGKVCWQGFPFDEADRLNADLIRDRIKRFKAAQ